MHATHNMMAHTILRRRALESNSAVACFNTLVLYTRSQLVHVTGSICISRELAPHLLLSPYYVQRYRTHVAGDVLSALLQR